MARAGEAVPAVVRNKARAVGAEGWLRDLPNLIASLEHEWSITEMLTAADHVARVRWT